VRYLEIEAHCTTNNTKSNTADFLHLYRSPKSGIAASASHNKYHKFADKVTVTTRRNKSPRSVVSFDEVTDTGTEIESMLDTTIGGDTTIGSTTMADTTMDTCTMGETTMDTNNNNLRHDTSHYCPCVQTCLDEMNGTYQDMKKTFNQVVYAFFISGDDIDRVVSLKCVYHYHIFLIVIYASNIIHIQPQSDKLRDAKVELLIYAAKTRQKGSAGPKEVVL